MDRTGSRLKPILAGSGLDRTAIFLKIGGSDIFLRTKRKFDMLGWLNENRGALFIIVLWMWTSRQSKLTINFFAASVGKWFNFY